MMSQIQFINEFPEEEVFTYDKRIRLLKERKLRQTQEKIDREGAWTRMIRARGSPGECPF